MIARHQIARHDPHAEMAERWPDWTVRPTALHGIDEVVAPASRLILLDATRATWDWAVAHALAHLDLGHHEDGRGAFTFEQEQDADWLARLRLDVG